MIIVGDSLQIMQQMDDNSVDIVITDPPYDWNKSQRDKAHGEIMRVTRTGAIVFCPPENLWQYPAVQYLFWMKPVSTKNTSRKYSRFVELILVYGDVQWHSGYHWSQYTNIFQDLVSDRKHPYAKPISMLERLIRNHTKENDIVLDPFMGSGTTLAASSRLNRRYIGIDIDEKCAKIATARS